MLRIPSQILKNISSIRSQANPLVKGIISIHKSQNSSHSQELLIQSPYLLFSLYDLGYRFDNVFINKENIDKMIHIVDDKVIVKQKEQTVSEENQLTKNVTLKKERKQKKNNSSSLKEDIEHFNMSKEQANQWLNNIFEMLDKRTPLYFCNESVLEKMSNLPSSSGYLATMKKPQYTFEKLLNNHKIRKIIVCDRVVDPGNMGTIIRNAVAYGYEAIITTPNSVHVYNDKVIRSSAGAVFKIPIIEGVEIQKIIQEFVRRTNGYTAYIATSDNYERVWDISNEKKRFIEDFKKRQLRHILWLSNETEGISNELNQLIPRGIGKRKSPFYNRIVEVNIDTKMESINVSVASGIIMHKLREYLIEAEKELEININKYSLFVSNNSEKIDFFELDDKKSIKKKSQKINEILKPAGRIATKKMKSKYKIVRKEEPTIKKMKKETV